MNRLILPLGIVLILVGGLASLFASQQATLPTWTAIAGVLLVAYFLVANWRMVARRSTFYGFNALLMSLATIAILAVVYLIAENRDKSWDLTATGRYTLDPQTASILDGLDKPVKILVFASTELRQSPNFSQMTDLLDEYKKRSDLLSYELLDPSKDYERAIKYTADLNPLGQITVIAEMEGEGTGVESGAETKGFREKAAGTGQEDISNAIKKVTHRETVTAYFIVGHQEKELDDEAAGGLSILKSFLADENIEASPLRLNAIAEIPDGADIIAAVGPQEDLTDTELEGLRQFVLRGGGLFMALDSGDLENTALRLRDFGFEIGNDLLIGMEVGAQSVDDLIRGRMTATPSQRVQITTFNTDHEISKDLGNSRVQVLTARSVDKIPAPPEGVTVTPLLQSDSGNVMDTDIPNSWADKHPEELQGGQGMPVKEMFDPKVDRHGPVPILTVAEVNLEDHPEGKPEPDAGVTKGKIVVVGDSDFISNAGMQIRGGISRGHLDLSLNCFNWLAGQVDLITIRKTEVDNTSITLTQDQRNRLQKLFVWVVPALIGLLGAAIVFYRRWMYV